VLADGGGGAVTVDGERPFDKLRVTGGGR
jgi:hypothetical protein